MECEYEDDNSHPRIKFRRCEDDNEISSNCLIHFLFLTFMVHLVINSKFFFL